MKFVIGGWVLAILILLGVLLYGYLGYQGRDEGGCTPSCFDLRVVGFHVVVGIAGAVVSVSLGYLHRSRTGRMLRVASIGSIIFLLLAISTFLMGGPSISVPFLIAAVFFQFAGRSLKNSRDILVTSQSLVDQPNVRQTK
ncbi:MAG: hypothetical protein O3B95_07700 [Chloroflexi bacterium]|nr:hypothetical protein [Chloroflexota bacterium]